MFDASAKWNDIDVLPKKAKTAYGMELLPGAIDHAKINTMVNMVKKVNKVNLNLDDRYTDAKGRETLILSSALWYIWLFRINLS